jgi:NAD(P)-dependent dehydrogenase (short-subunit alcohol dehydrogenase family)
MKTGKILNISSIMATLNLISKWIRQPMNVKAALNMYTFISKIKRENIDVNSIHPGWVNTKLSREGAINNRVFSKWNI